MTLGEMYRNFPKGLMQVMRGYNLYVKFTRDSVYDQAVINQNEETFNWCFSRRKDWMHDYVHYEYMAR